MEIPKHKTQMTINQFKKLVMTKGTRRKENLRKKESKSLTRRKKRKEKKKARRITPEKMAFVQTRMKEKITGLMLYIQRALLRQQKTTLNTQTTQKCRHQ